MVVLGRKPGGAGGGGSPTGAAGGDLSGTYPNPALSVAKQAELDGKVPKSLYDANTVLAANSDDTPAAITMGASTILARLAAGNIKAASVAEILTLLDVPTNAQAILDSIVDAKGDLIVATAADTVARKAVGATDGMGLLVKAANADGLEWALPSGYQFDYVEITSPVTVSATVEATPTAVISGNAVTYDGSTRVLIEFSAPYLTGGSNAQTVVNLWDGSTDLGRIAQSGPPSAGTMFNPCSGKRFLTPSAAAHTYHIKAWRVSADGQVGAGAGGAGNYVPAFMRITKA